MGDSLAITALGDCYYYGRAVEKNLKKAQELYRKAAEMGDPYGQSNLACSYDGFGETIDYGQAVYWYEKAAAKGMLTAYTNLAICYRDGKGVKKDIHKAIELLNTAIERGSSTAVYLLGCIYSRVESTIEEKIHVSELFEKGARLGNVNCMSKLAWRLENGIAGDRDFEQAYYWFKKAAEAEYGYAMIQAGEYMLVGRVTLQDVAKGLDLIKKGMEKQEGGTEFANFLLGWCCETGTGMPKNFERALEYYNKAADDNSEEALYRLALYYGEGQNLPPDLEKAVEYAKRVSKNLQFSSTCKFDEDLKIRTLALLKKLRGE